VVGLVSMVIRVRRVSRLFRTLELGRFLVLAEFVWI
jgi:hypothetical protein